ncbi:MAG: HAMP domain-containing protein [Desulfarculaceae bacterium]|nr:HAMP domain-containing protein [Desulfarculaceae bacterium]MCF8072982.1 HAMP domain-containing protein [Desulfarculaceae bacterium]MCF8100722.1 HAMP domain-containing protein [Desulfarculaceae bacterium]MCF8115460.1 HAMP domain-containing protein [Desulfarculaceae bacterium]
MKNDSLKPRWLRLRARFVIFVLSGVALVSAAMAVVSHMEASSALLDASQAYLLSLAEAQANQLARRLDSVAGPARDLATSLELVGVKNESFATALLKQNLIANPHIYGMALALAPYSLSPSQRYAAVYAFRSPKGLKVMDLNNPRYDYLSQNWYLIPALLGRPVWSEPYFDEGAGNVLMTTYSAPMVDKGKMLGVVTADVDLGDLGKLVRSLSLHEGGYGFLLTRQGTFLAAPDPNLVMRASIFSVAEEMQRPELRALGRHMVRGAAGLREIIDPLNQQKAWLAYAPVKGVGWSFGVVAPSEAVLAPVTDLTTHQLFFAVVGLAILGLVVLLMVVGLTRPVKLLTHGAKRLSGGDLACRVEGIRPGDEVGELANTFNTMASDLSAHVEELKRKKQELEDSLHRIELLENIEQTLGKFVPASVKARIEEAPEAPDLKKREQDVSVLFLDVAGYTKMSEQVNGEDMNFLIERYFSSFLDDIYVNHGDINETAGDGLMIIFQEDDPVVHAVNAVTCALAVRHKVAAVNRELEGRFQPVTINIGVNSGTAQVGSSRFEGLAGTRWTFTASGPVTNTAARIGALATQGEIYLGPETAKRVEDRFELKAIGPQTLKNVAQPVEVFAVQGPKAA